MNRRTFLGASAGLALLPTMSRAARQSPANKLNVALIGVYGRGLAFYHPLSEENVVALCDVDERRFPEALKHFPQARTYVDWRRCLDHPGLDAVVICTTDHTHAFIANWALNRNLHVYCEKPLTITVEEARLVRANWLPKKGRIATQVGTQLHANPNYNRIREMIHDGAIGTLEAARAWGDRQIRRAGNLPAEGSPPAGLHFDLWLGPAPDRPFNPGYFSGEAGLNCLNWNMFWDFSAGQVGDMGTHTMDLIWNAVDATLPTSAEARGEAYNPEVTPVELECHFEHPANDWRGPITISWYQGGRMPESPRPFLDLRKIGHGVMFEGTEGFLVADFGSRILQPLTDRSDMTYYRPRPKEAVIPNMGDFVKQWLDACRDPQRKTDCDFEYSGNMIEQLLLGLVAYRAGRKISYDGATGRVTDNPEADGFLRRTYRRGWTLNG